MSSRDTVARFKRLKSAAMLMGGATTIQQIDEHQLSRRRFLVEELILTSSQLTRRAGSEVLELLHHHDFLTSLSDDAVRGLVGFVLAFGDRTTDMRSAFHRAVGRVREVSGSTGEASARLERILGQVHRLTEKNGGIPPEGLDQVLKDLGSQRTKVIGSMRQLEWADSLPDNEVLLRFERRIAPNMKNKRTAIPDAVTAVLSEVRNGPSTGARVVNEIKVWEGVDWVELDRLARDPDLLNDRAKLEAFLSVLWRERPDKVFDPRGRSFGQGLVQADYARSQALVGSAGRGNFRYVGVVTWEQAHLARTVQPKIQQIFQTIWGQPTGNRELRIENLDPIDTSTLPDVDITVAIHIAA